MTLRCCSNGSLTTKRKQTLVKCHLLVNKKDEVVINLGQTEIKNSEYEKLLGVKVDTK